MQATATANGSDAGTGSRCAFTALVLAGGAGTRLASVLADRPKPLAPVDGEPFLVRLLDQLAASGCTHVVLCTGHLGDQVEREVGREHAGVPVTCVREPDPRGTAGALGFAAANCALPGGADGVDGVLVANGDTFVDTDLARFVAFARLEPAVPALLAVHRDDRTRYGALALAGDRVTALHEKRADAGPGPIHAGVLWLPAAVLASLPHDRAASLEHDVLPRLVASGLRARLVDAPFLDIGTPDAFAAAPAFFAACAARRARPRKGLLVLDRDGTLIEERHYLADPTKVALLPGVVDGLRRFAANGYDLAVVTNQSGIGRGYFDEPALAAVHAELERQLAAAGISLRGIWHCPHAPAARCTCRKPEPELLDRALGALGFAPEQCLVVGDKACDIELGRRRGTRTALVRTGYGAGTERDGLCAPDVVADDLAALARAALAPEAAR